MRRSSITAGSGRGRRGPEREGVALLCRFAAAGVALLAVAATGCATKNDLKQLRSEVIALQARQDSLFQELLSQNRVLMDSMRAGTELVYRVRGDLGFQLQQMEQQLIQIQELSGQSQRRLAELREQWESRAGQFASSPGLGAPMPPEGGGDAEQLYALGMEKLSEGATTAARMAFEGVVNSHSTHELAPDAQFQIGESYLIDQDYDRALRELERVVELFPDSPRAPQALYRAGLIAEERRNISKAREYFNRVQRGYPRSDEARMAADALRRLRGS